MSAQQPPGYRSGFELSPDEINSLSLTETEEKILYLRYLIHRETQNFKLIRYQYLVELLQKRIHDLQAGTNTVLPGKG